MPANDERWAWHDAPLIGVYREGEPSPYEIGCIDLYAEADGRVLAGSYLPMASFADEGVATIYYYDAQGQADERGLARNGLPAFVLEQARAFDPTVDWRPASGDEIDAYEFQRDLELAPAIDVSDPALDDALLALNAFAATADVPGWNMMTGREVVHILSGNVYLSLAGQAALRCDRAEVLAQADLAITEFEAANAITNADPEARPYARPYTGIAAALLLRARWLPPENDGCADTLYDMSPLRDGLVAIDEARRILVNDATSSEDVIKARM